MLAGNLLVTCWQYIKHQENHKKENAKNRPHAKIKELQKLENGNVATTKEIRTIFY